MNEKQVFVSGTWRADLAVEFIQAATTAGEMIAAAGCSLACGPGTGIARYAVDGFRSVVSRTGVVRYYLPDRARMAAVGEDVLPGADEIIETDYDYPMRNVYQVSRSAGLIAITGNEGTLGELLLALVDYRMPVGVLQGSGPAAVGLERLVDTFPSWNDNLLISADVVAATTFVLERLP